MESRKGFSEIIWISKKQENSPQLQLGLADVVVMVSKEVGKTVEFISIQYI